MALQEDRTDMLRKGLFAGPVVGLRYETPTCSGFTDHEGTFEYRDGEVVSFSVGAVLVGTARGARSGSPSPTSWRGSTASSRRWPIRV